MLFYGGISCRLSDFYLSAHLDGRRRDCYCNSPFFTVGVGFYLQGQRLISGAFAGSDAAPLRCFGHLPLYVACDIDSQCSPVATDIAEWRFGEFQIVGFIIFATI